jgi:hypothetical protein
LTLGGPPGASLQILTGKDTFGAKNNPPNPPGQVCINAGHQSTPFSLSNAPKMTKIFNKVPEISPFEVFGHTIKSVKNSDL